MADDVQRLILTELQALRADYNIHARETGERLSALESQMHSLVGNGQPGRIAVVEHAVERLKAWRWKMAGVAAACSMVCVAISWIIEYFVVR